MTKLVILGVRGQVDDAEALVKVIQGRGSGEGLALNADLVCGRDHLRSAVMHARRAFERGDNVCSSLSVEAVLYASGERQISKAVRKMGTKAGDERVALVLFDVDDVDGLLSALRFSRDDDVLEPSAEKAVRFGITPDEIKAVPPDMVEDLVLERVAFVSLHK